MLMDFIQENLSRFQEEKKDVSKGYLENEDQVLSKKFLEDLVHKNFSKDQKATFDSIEVEARELFEQNFVSQAESLLLALHTKGLGTSQSYSLLGACYHQRNLFKKALECYNQSLKMEPLNCESLMNLSLLRLDLGDYQKGYIPYKKAFYTHFQNKEKEWKRSVAEQHYQFGMRYYDQGYYHEALLEFLKVVPVFKNIIPINLYIIRCLWNLNQKKRAFQKLQELEKKYPQSTDVLLVLGEFYFQVQKITLAISKWERVLKMDSQNKVALKWLSKVQDIQSVEEAPLA